jgi:hypothetical protein
MVSSSSVRGSGAWTNETSDVTEQLEPLVSQRDAAAFLHVSQTYLRASSCPKVLLPGNGPKDRPLVRYRLKDVAAWSEEWAHRATEPQRRPFTQKAG